MLSFVKPKLVPIMGTWFFTLRGVLPVLLQVARRTGRNDWQEFTNLAQTNKEQKEKRERTKYSGHDEGGLMAYSSIVTCDLACPGGPPEPLQIAIFYFLG